MARPSRKGGKTSAARTRNASSAKGRTPKTRAQKTQTVDPQQLIAELRSELDRARWELAARNSAFSERIAYQEAANDVLKVMSASPGDPQPVFDLISVRARDLCDAYGVTVYEYDGSLVHWRAATGVSDDPAVREAAKAAFPLPPTPDLVVGRAILSCATVHIRNYEVEPGLRRFSLTVKSSVAVPLLRGGVPIGALQMGSRECGGFSDAQIGLLETFADQAVIAIENARLFNEVQERTRDLSEALEYQTATSDVLRIVAGSPASLQPVFDAMLEKAVALCDAKFGTLFLYENGRFTAVADRNLPTSYAQAVQGRSFSAQANTGFRLLMESKAPLHIPDMFADSSYARGEPLRVAAIELGGVRSLLAVPLLRKGELIGNFSIYRAESGGFVENQINLLTTFADQAVVAISNTQLFEQLQAKTRDLTESLQQQTATADVLKIISRSAFNLQSVLDTLVESAAHLCEADYAWLFERDGDLLRFKSSFGHDAEVHTRLRDLLLSRKANIHRGSIVGRSTLEARVVHVADVLADPEWNRNDAQQIAGYRAALGAPLLRDGNVVGAIFLAKGRPEPFNQKQIELVTTFADQAVIAIENARLFNETQEALDRQTATADILKVITSSPDDVQPVFEAIAKQSNRLLNGLATAVYRLVDDVAHLMSFTPVNAAADAHLKASFPVPLADVIWGAPIARGEILRVADSEAPSVPRRLRDMGRIRGWRSVVYVPLVSDTKSIGAISVTRVETGSFADHHVELLQTFADQAAIAISNVELFQQVQNRTKELSEALQFQTAASDVLRVISRSPDKLQPVLDAIVETSRELCGSDASTIFLLRDEKFHVMAVSGPLPAHLDQLRANPLAIDQRGSTLARIAREKRTLHNPNVMDDPELREGLTGLGGPRALLSVPLMKDGDVIGAITLRQSHLRPFTERQIQAIETFADQAVIAISNVNLFNEVQAKTHDLEESLLQQTATADVLKVIASSPTDVGPVLQAIVESACQLCESDDATVALKDGYDLVFKAQHGSIPIVWDRIPINRQMVTGRAVIDSQPVHVRDLYGPEGEGYPDAREFARQTDVRTVLSVPLLREGESIGVITLRRTEVEPFSDKQINLLQTFADQAVIAIGNVRLFEQVQERTRELSISLDDLRTAQDRLIQTEKLASLGQLTAGIAHEIKNPLNFVNNFAALSVELTDELKEVMNLEKLTDKGREEVDEVTGLLKENLNKVVQHGKRADSIVKNMLLHSREGSGERRSADINALVGESLNLAYHGARAEKPGFTITLKHDLDPNAGALDLYPQEITRALLNLIANGFYAATKRKVEAGDDSFEPVLSAATRSLDNTVEIRIRDNGTGIPPEVREKMFNPFFTTKPTGEGTGLGLSMTHDIIVKQHGGRIEVETEPGAFTEFIITLPRGNGTTAKSEPD